MNDVDRTHATAMTAKMSRRTWPIRVEDWFWRGLVSAMPQTRQGDYIVSLLRFLRMHRRWPDASRLWFNDQLFRIKTSEDILDPVRVFTSDKEWVKIYVAGTVGTENNVPTLKILQSMEQCAHFDFPDRCAIKPTHLSGTVIIRRSGEAIDFGRIAQWFSHNNYPRSREANYRSLKPKVIVEPLVFDNDNASDFKIFCVRGKPKLIQVDSNRFLGHTRNFYDVSWKRLRFHMTHPPGDTDDAAPANLREMLDLAARLSRPFSFVRVDLYSNGTAVLVGELTHCHGSADEFFVPRSDEAIASELLFDL